MKQAIIYILSFLGIISQMSCDDQLNALPTQSKVVGNVIVDQKSAEVALNGVYYRFAQGGDDRNTPSILRALRKSCCFELPSLTPSHAGEETDW